MFAPWWQLGTTPIILREPPLTLQRVNVCIRDLDTKRGKKLELELPGYVKPLPTASAD
jgi:hypothetical protein